MNIIIFGATGDVGSRVAKEAVSRGHSVTGVIRSLEKADKLPEGVKARIGNASLSRLVSDLSSGHDLIVSAVRPPEGQEPRLVAMTKAIFEGAAESGVRAIIVGGAARLIMPGEKEYTVLSSPGFLPDSVVPIAKACFEQYQMCLENSTVNWAYISPPALLRPGVRTGKYRLGKDELIIDSEGASKISLEDFAVAILDEAENKKHQQTAFTVAY